MRGSSSIPTVDNILSLDFLFLCSKASDPGIAIFVQFVKNPSDLVGLSHVCS